VCGPYDPVVRVEIGLLGGFTVCVDGVALPAGEWKRRNAAALVKLLALAPRARLHRDRVVDALWPEVDLDAALPRLHKAAHFARQTLRSRDAVVLKDEVVSLFPGDVLDIDVAAFEAAADAALRPGAGSADACTAAAALYRGELLPDDLGEPWSEEPRGRLRSRFVQLLRTREKINDTFGGWFSSLVLWRMWSIGRPGWRAGTRRLGRSWMSGSGGCGWAWRPESGATAVWRR